MTPVFNKKAMELAAAIRKDRGPVPLLAEKGDAAQLFIYSPIGEAFNGISAKQVTEELSRTKARSLDVYISSEGGDVFEGIAIHNAIGRFPGRKTTYVDGLAASAASLVLMAGDERIAMPSSQVMVHEAWSIGMGNAADLRKLADLLEKTSDSVADVYVKRCGKDLQRVKGWMADETWFDTSEALSNGLIDRVAEPPVQNIVREPPRLSAIDTARLLSRAKR